MNSTVPPATDCRKKKRKIYMDTNTKLQKYRDWQFKMSAYRMALSIISVDKATVAPAGGNAYRDKRTAYLAGELFTIETDPEVFQLLGELKDDETLDFETRREISMYHKEIMHAMCIPKDEFVAARELFDASYNAWLEAKTKSDYSIFAPYLKQVIETQKKLYSYRNSDMALYDQMLDDYEPGMNREKYDAFFAVIREKLVPLIHKVTQAPQIDESFLHDEFSINRQKDFMETLLPYLHFDPEWGCQNETEHPFTNWTCENDCRITTKYLKDNVVSAMLSTIHEAGHATYEHNCDPKYDGTILSDGISSGMHESQSRLFENYLGRTQAFWEYNFPKLKEVFPIQFANVTTEKFVRAINVAKPSLIRTEADELTYPLHILIRYEIEKGLFDGTISTEGLDETWNELYKKYLGVDVPNARCGILQDVHWSDGNFGYFPTYALGSAFAAQFTARMRKDMDVDDALRNNRFDECVAWLKENIQKYGALYEADEIMKKATGKEFDVNYYIEYLENKYKTLYQLD